VIVGFCSGDGGNIELRGVLEGGKICKYIGLLGVLEGGKIGKGVSDDGDTLGEGAQGAREGETNGLCMPDFADTLILTF